MLPNSAQSVIEFSPISCMLCSAFVATNLVLKFLFIQGTALGNNREGLIEPLQAVGNKGNAGLGWNQRSV